MKILFAIVLTLTCSACVVQQGAVQVNVLCNRTIVDARGLHYTKDEINHVHCDIKNRQLSFKVNL